MKKFLSLPFVAVLFWSYSHFFGAITHPPGVLVKKDPVQVMIDTPMEPIQKEGFTLKPLARYTIEARVLHRKRYWHDPVSDIAPYDLAVGWGPMSDQSVLDKLSISQGNRFYFYEWQNQPPIPKDQIIPHSANMHLIPSSSAVQRKIAWLRIGELVRLRGLLIEATNSDMPGAPPWRSSLSRTDTGNGACEILWVESVERL